MKTRTWLGVAVSSCATGALVAVIACSSSSVPPPPPGGGGGGGQCSTSAGQFPVANCVSYAPDAQLCNSPSLTCSTSPCSSSSPCLAMGADNTGQSVASLRLRKLNVTAPAALAMPLVQKTVIDQGINLKGFCGEGGDGTFSWLMQLDTTKNTITTGGAPPVADPFGTGYCFVNTMIGGLNVAPVTGAVTKNSDGSFNSGLIPKLNVPIFLPVTGGAPQSVVVLPLSGATVKNITLSSSNNCIGQYNADAVTPLGDGGTCLDDPSSCARWTTAGSLGGYITLNEADGVLIPQLSESLCVLLTSNMSVDTSGPEKLCLRSGGTIVAKGDFCSTTNSPGGCADSFWLAATFAASAVKIVAPNQPACMGVPIGDGGAGSDGGTGGDTGTASDAQGQ